MPSKGWLFPLGALPGHGDASPVIPGSFLPLGDTRPLAQEQAGPEQSPLSRYSSWPLSGMLATFCGRGRDLPLALLLCILSVQSL